MICHSFTGFSASKLLFYFLSAIIFILTLSFMGICHFSRASEVKRDKDHMCAKFVMFNPIYL